MQYTKDNQQYTRYACADDGMEFDLVSGCVCRQDVYTKSHIEIDGDIVQSDTCTSLHARDKLMNQLLLQEWYPQASFCIINALACTTWANSIGSQHMTLH